LPDLRVIPSAALLLHEESDPVRVERLIGSFAAEGVLRNPPVAAPLDGGSYVVLDGANRVTALTQAGYPDQVVQVVDVEQPSVILEVWAHLLAEDVVSPPGVPWQRLSVEAVRAGLGDGTLACGVVTEAGARGFPAPPDLAGRVAAIAGVVAAYRRRGPFYRVQPNGLDVLRREYGRVGALVLFPRLQKAEIRAIARLPVKLPSGISRFIVHNRALRVNVDLALLRSGAALHAKQAQLDDLIRSRLVAHRVRAYPESTVLLDD
jgi:hypothetical protein